MGRKPLPVIRIKHKGRPPGSKNKPKKLLDMPNVVSGRLLPMAPERVVELKLDIIDLLEEEKAETLSGAAKILGLNKLRVHAWRRNDKEFASMVDAAQEVIADRLEEELNPFIVQGKIINYPYVMARIFRLKALRPHKYRDNYKFDIENSNLTDLLTDLKRLGQKPPKVTVADDIINVEPKQIEEVCV